MFWGHGQKLRAFTWLAPYVSLSTIFMLKMSPVYRPKEKNAMRGLGNYKCIYEYVSLHVQMRYSATEYERLQFAGRRGRIIMGDMEESIWKRTRQLCKKVEGNCSADPSAWTSASN